MPVDTQVAKSKVIGEENHYIRRAFFDCRRLIRDRRAAGDHQKRKHADCNSRPKRPSQYQGPHGRTSIIDRSGVSGGTNTNTARLIADFPIGLQRYLLPLMAGMERDGPLHVRPWHTAHFSCLRRKDQTTRLQT